MIGYPTTGVDLQRGHTQVGMALLAAASLALAVLVGLAPAIITRRRRRLGVVSVTTALVAAQAGRARRGFTGGPVPG